MNLIIWGAGREYIKNKHLLKHLDYKLVDTSEEKQGSIVDGVIVENPDILLKIKYDYIVVTTDTYFEEIYHRLITQYFVPNRQIIRLYDIDKEILMRNIGTYKALRTSGPKIMFGYCFLQYENCRIHDYLLAESLRFRGAEIIPVICGGIQELDCSGYGGKWGNDTHDITNKEINHSRNCSYCLGCNKLTWSEWGNFSIISANDFVTDEDKLFVREFVHKLEIKSISNWRFQYFPIGKWALRRYFNKELISHKNEWNEIEVAEIRSLAFNVMIMCIASLKIVEDVKPEVIYSNDSFYYPYSILEMIAKKKNIPFYNAYGFRKGTYSYALNTPSVNMDFDSAWKTFSQKELSDDEKTFIEHYIINRRYGADMMLNTADPFQSVKQIKPESIYGIIDNKKKTALIATNVTWDAAALDRGIVFENTADWVLHTIDWFVNNNEWQLIVRAHPAEINKLIPEARERICSIILKKYHNKLPSNIILIDGDAPVSIYDLLGIVDLGIVYTSTVGLEMCCNGIPVILVAEAPYRGKGFTYDPTNVKEYEEQLEKHVKVSLIANEIEVIKKQARKFFLMYYFIYMLSNPFYRFAYGERAEMLIKTPSELMPGQNQIWDYICDSILAKKPILSGNRFPPYRLEV